MRNYSISREVRTWHILAKVITASHSVPYMTYIDHVVTGVWCGGHMQCPCVYCLCSSRSDIVFNRSACAITDHSQSVKDIDPYFKSQLNVENDCHQKLMLNLPNWLSKPRVSARQKLDNFCRDWHLNPQPLDRQASMLPLSYHRHL